MNPETLEGSIQSVLSVLYPPFESTAPVLLSQLFQVIDSRYQGDALKCLLDFLVPAKHILDTVQQAACAQYSNVLFVCEGWPLCLHDKVVVHLASIKPLCLQPGDFYLQVAPFCDQSARILVCSLLEEEEEGPCSDLVEETPIPETLYPCIFSLDWLVELNRGRHGTPLSQCLLSTEQGVVRMPWEQVALPRFLDEPECARSSMASAHSSFSGPSPSVPRFSSPSCLFLSPSSSSETSHSSSSNPSAFSVQTRICPAKHGIAVSLYLVENSTKVAKETEAAAKSDSHMTGTFPHAWTRSDSAASASENPKNTVATGRREPAGQVPAEGDYIDVLQAALLFGGADTVAEGQQRSSVALRHQMERQTQRHQHAQMEPSHRQAPPLSPCQSRLPSTPHMHIRHSEPSARPDVCVEAGPPFPLHHSYPHHAERVEAPQCVRAVRFLETPCTPCMKRRQGAKVTKAQELRCRYRDSYQAALQNPVNIGRNNERDMTTVVEEDPTFLQCGPRKPQSESEDAPCQAGRVWPDFGAHKQTPSVNGFICQESGEQTAAPCWKPEDMTCMDHGNNSALKREGQREFTHQTSTGPLREPPPDHYDQSNGHCKHVASLAAPQGNRGFAVSSSAAQPDLILTPQNRSTALGRSTSAPEPQEGPHAQTSSTGVTADFSQPQSRRESVPDGRCSSLSTAVVETSEKCELVIVEGRNVRRRETADSCAEIPQLHVVKFKKSTAFRLVSPKISRKKVPLADDSKADKVDPPGCQSLLGPARVADMQGNLQASTARPRPNHLPLGSPDPRTHPLYLGVATLTGGRDKTGRAIVEIYGDHPGWRSNITSQELQHTLLYFYTITRREVRVSGMTLLFDARKMNPLPQFYKALMSLQEQNPQAVNSLVLMVDKGNRFRPETCPGIQTDVVTSLKSLVKIVEESQRSSRLEGTLSPSYCDWTELHQKLFPFVCDLHEASGLLLRAIRKLEEPHCVDSVQSVKQCMLNQRTLMKDVLEDSRLVGLQREGGAILARLRKESDFKYPDCENLSDAVDSLTSLYNFVEEQVHVVVQKSNESLEHLQYLQQIREMEGHFTQMQQWFQVEGEHHLLEAQSVEESGEQLEQILNSFTAFLIEANDRRHHAMTLASEAERLQQAGLEYPETEAFRTLVSSFRSGLEDFLCRAEACGRELQIMVNVCDFCDQASALAQECCDYLEHCPSRGPNTQDCSCHQTRTSLQDQVSLAGSEGQAACTADVSGPDSHNSVLQSYLNKFLQFSAERFQEVKTQASALRGSRGMQVWNSAWLRCQEAQQLLQERVQEEDYHRRSKSSNCCERHYLDVVSTNAQTATPAGQSAVVQSTPGPQHPQWEGLVSGAVDLNRRPLIEDSGPNVSSRADSNNTPAELNHTGGNEGSNATPPTPHRSSRGADREARRRQAIRARSERDAAALSQSHTVGCQWFPWSRGLKARTASQDPAPTEAAAPATPPEERVRSPSSCSQHGPPSSRVLQEAQKFQLSRHGSFCSEDSCVSDQGAAGGNSAVLCKHSSLPAGRYEGVFGVTGPQEGASTALRLQRVLEELVFTEREYVRSLGYILTHYLPLLDSPDVPQDLRGKRGIIFGNLEKLHDFHSRYFLPELEACQREPVIVARCFLRHSESFGLYALYSKNKPRSDALILHRRHDVFKKKQQELGDLMDLSSYLLRPIQRISKYSLLLQDMLALVSSRRHKSHLPDLGSRSSVSGLVPDLTQEIHDAAELVRFQMRHGNDLLTMDAIQDCDVNLKEQGQLIRQDEFTVLFRKKKCVRRIFLFEHLILFSKTKKTDVGNDVYVYKQSFKTCDIGMTHNSAVGSLCFEIWFRRRKSQDTYTLKAPSMEMKKAWTADLERILWDQAAHSRELRMQERVFMGMCRKPFMDIHPSEAAIRDRAIAGVQPGRIPVACCSHRSVEFPRPHSIGSGSTASTTISQSSSSSGRGSLPPASYAGAQLLGADAGPAVFSSPEPATDNELNHLHQHLHHDCDRWKNTRRPQVLDTSDSSAECSQFNPSDGSVLSALGGDVTDSSFASRNCRSCTPLSRTPSLRINGSPAVTRKRAVAPTPPPLTATQSDLIGKSTEV
ncbi:uncharacterized protein LOC128750072 isoform X1 [Synchiropus splendidus]|uniref:uncharacterized protein LOC128750072 isoform X1 n=1 Tax=Synchiropus splendidus TaxID=270530 RepID=UPI00237E08CF|nr:uncharacterized protein LOC128750072 isoform X1 [Synchiropus splendidus]